jgi:hypothetical protein
MKWEVTSYTCYYLYTLGLSTFLAFDWWTFPIMVFLYLTGVSMRAKLQNGFPEEIVRKTWYIFTPWSTIDWAKENGYEDMLHEALAKAQKE